MSGELKLKNGKLQKWLNLSIVLSIFILSFKLAADIWQRSLLLKIKSGISLNSDVANFSDSVSTDLTIILAFVYLAQFIIFLIWIKNAYQNKEALYGNTDFKIGWAIGSFFVPILNFVRPMQIMREMITKFQNRYILKNSDNLILLIWWFSLWIGNIIRGYANSLSRHKPLNIEDYISIYSARELSGFLNIIMLIMQLYLVIKINAYQIEKLKTEFIVESTT